MNAVIALMIQLPFHRLIGWDESNTGAFWSGAFQNHNRSTVSLLPHPRLLPPTSSALSPFVFLSSLTAEDGDHPALAGVAPCWGLGKTLGLLSPHWLVLFPVSLFLEVVNLMTTLCC